MVGETNAQRVDEIESVSFTKMSGYDSVSIDAKRCGHILMVSITNSAGNLTLNAYNKIAQLDVSAYDEITTCALGPLGGSNHSIARLLANGELDIYAGATQPNFITGTLIAFVE